MGLWDRFRRRGGPSRGVRQGRRGERRPDERTESIRAYPPGQGPPPPPASGGPENPRTVAMPQPGPLPPPRSAPPTPMPDPVAPPRPSAPSYPGEEPSDAEKTVYEEVRPRSKGKIVGVLVGVDGPCDGKLYGIFDGENTLGRGEQCRVVLSREDRRISREHAEVIHRDGVFVIRPLKQKAITRVNDEETEGSGLCHGDSLTLGDSTFRFVSVY